MSKRENTAIHTTAGATSFDMGLWDVMDSLEDELLVVDSQYRVRLANLTLRRKLAKGAKLPIGKHCYEVFHGRQKPCTAPLWECPLRKVLQGGGATVIIHPDLTLGAGTMSNRYTKLTMYPLRDSHGNVDAAVELRRDVTAERELEKEILKRRHHLDALSRVSCAVSGLRSLDAILDVGLGTVLDIINGSIGGILLSDEETETLSYRVHRGLSAKYAEEMRLRIGEGIAGRVAQTGEPVLLEDISTEPHAARPDLISTEGLKGFVSVPLKAKDKVVGVMNIASHIAGQFSADDMHLLKSIGCQLGTAVEQARLHRSLSSATERYQRLLRQVLTIQEQERKRIARELHDETGQELTALALNLQAISQMMEMSSVVDPRIKPTLNKAHSLATHAGTELTKLIRELRPTLLDTLGLPAAVGHLAEANLNAQGIDVVTEFKGLDQRLPAESELSLFRIIQEAMSNIVKHAGAKNVSINIECNANECVLRIEDNGKGFDVSQVTGIDEGGRGAGLFGMKERVTMIGGTCSCQSQPGQGTIVVAKVPIMRSTADGQDKGADSR